ncbi:MAG: hypothetical protein V1725_05230 [archaeon]
MQEQKKILTGPDKLIELVSKEKKITVDKAAKELGVSVDVIKDWALFLEEEGLITVEYSLSTMFLEERRLSKSEVAKKTKEYLSHKESFIRKVETSLNNLEDSADAISRFRKEFEEVRNGLAQEIEKVKNELLELKQYEDMKHNLDTELDKQRMDYAKKIDDAHRQLGSEEKRFMQLIGDVKNTEGTMTSEEKKVISLEAQEEAIRKRIDEMQGRLKLVRDDLNKERATFKYSEEHLEKLRKVAEEILGSLSRMKKKFIDPLVEAQFDHERKIQAAQDAVLRKARQTQRQLQSGTPVDVSKRFERFFEKQKELDDILKKMDEERLQLKMEYEQLIKKASVFDSMKSSTSTKDYVKDLENAYEELEKRHAAYKMRVLQARNALQFK